MSFDRPGIGGVYDRIYLAPDDEGFERVDWRGKMASISTQVSSDYCHDHDDDVFCQKVRPILEITKTRTRTEVDTLSGFGSERTQSR